MRKIAILLTLTLFSFTLHKYYISLTDINYAQEKKTVQITTNLFVNDLEVAINNQFNIKSNFNGIKEIKNIDSYLEKYLKSHLQIKINKTAKQFKYLGKEIDGDIVYFFLEIPNINKLDNIDFINTLLLKDFPSQRNIIKVKKQDQRKSLILNNDESKGSINF